MCSAVLWPGLCVVYPPLCFAGQPGENVVYKSKIKEIIDEWKKNR